MKKFALHSVLRLMVVTTLLLGFWFIPSSLGALPAPFKLRVFPGFNRHLAPSTWIPITIELETSEQPLTGELVIDLPHDYILTGEATKTEYIIPLALPAFARRTYRTTIFRPAGAYSPPRLKVYSQEQLIFQQDLKLEQAPTGRGILVVSNQEYNIELTTLNRPVFQLKPDLLPTEPVGYWGVDALILDPGELAFLTAQQIDALEIWVRHGRTILLTGGIRQTLDSPLLKRFTSCRIKQKTVLPLTGDKVNALGFPENLQWLEVLQVEPGTAEVLLAVQATPLLLKEAFGTGTCYFLTFDPFAPSLASWSAREDLLGALLAVPGLAGETKHGIFDHLLPELLRSSSQTLPSKLWVLGMVTGLSLLLYLYSRCAENLKLGAALSGYLLFIAVFSGFCYFTFNRLLADDQISLSELAIIHKGPQQTPAQIEGYYSFFARKTSGLELTMNRNAGALTALSPQAGVGFSAPLRIQIAEQQCKLQLTSVDDNWLTMGFRANYLAELPVYVQTKNIGEDRLEVQINNAGELTLERVLLYSGRRWFILGPVAPGDTGFFRVDLNEPGENFATGILLYPQSWGRRTDPAALRRELLNTAASRLFSAANPQTTSLDQKYLLCLVCGKNLSGSIELNKPGRRSFSGLWLLPLN